MWAVHVAAHADKFDCDRCPYWKHCDDSNPSPVPQWEIAGEKLKVCPKGKITGDSWEWIRWYSHYTKQLLPTMGGVLDQTAKYIEAMETIERTKGTINVNT